MPERTLYDEAMMLSPARLQVQDPDLKHGKVEMINIPTVRGSMPRPWGIEGGFAVVYKFRRESGRARALRCFRVPIKPDTQFRYERISSYFHQYIPEITAEFRYYEKGILLKEFERGQIQQKTYPVVEMEWIEGLTLLDYVDGLCKKRDLTGLGLLTDQWLKLLMTMRKATMAHGDLAGGNVMVRDDGRLVLIDYDGVYIPDFAGLQQVVLGQPDYQHPQMNQRPFDEHMDHFSALMIYTALLALQIQPSLWEQYTQRNPQGKLLNTTLLFGKQDFAEPHQSSLIHDLERIHDARLQMVLQTLKTACLQDIDQIEFPSHLLDPDFERNEILQPFRTALHDDDDEQIIAAYKDIQASPQNNLITFTPQELSRLTLAQQRKDALLVFRKARMSHGTKALQMIASYDPILDNYQSVTSEEREILRSAHRFVHMYKAVLEAIATNDEPGIRQAYDKNLLGQFTDFTREQQQSIALAVNKEKLDQALRSKAYGLALRIVHTLETTWHTPIHDVRLGTARSRFIEQFHPTRLEAKFLAHEVRLQWQWPHDDLVQYAILLWRTDRWPLHPRRNDPGTMCYRIHRSSYMQHGSFFFKTGPCTQIYIQVYLAIPHPSHFSGETQWYYSNGKEPTSMLSYHYST